MKKLISMAVCLLVAVLMCVPSFADDLGYYIKSYDVNGVLHENNTVTQTETLTLHYTETSHGFFRAFPEWVKITRTLDDGTQKDYSYRVKLDVLSVDGAPYDVYTEDDYYYIKLGDADQYVSGDMTYQLSFVYDIGDDRIADYDEIFYSINGPDWDTYIENFTFNMSFEKPIPDESAASMALYSGSYGYTGNEYIEWAGDENGISGHSTQPLPARTGVTVQTYLPEGYFANERGYSLTPAYIVGIILAAMQLIVIAKALISHSKRPVQTVEFYPPDDISSAEVGYIIDEASNDNDIISLVIWFASKGYLSIEQKDKKTLILNKLKDLPASSPKYQRTIFNALFRNRERTPLDDLPDGFFNDFTKAKTELASEFTGERSLHKKGGEIIAFALPGIAVVLMAIFASLAAAGSTSAAGIFPCVSAVFMAGVLFVAICASVRWTFASHGGRVMFLILGILAALLSWGSMLLAQDEVLMNPIWLQIAFVLTLICCLLAPRLAVYTTYRTEMTGKLLGLRDFIKKAELPKLKMLVEQDPSYYYNIIPYAYVFGLSSVWARQFESLAIAPPSWYYTNDGLFNMIMFDSMMRNSFTNSIASERTETMNSGSGGSFGGGGGFSGGGFGGGGGGRW